MLEHVETVLAKQRWNPKRWSVRAGVQMPEDYQDRTDEFRSVWKAALWAIRQYCKKHNLPEPNAVYKLPGRGWWYVAVVENPEE